MKKLVLGLFKTIERKNRLKMINELLTLELSITDSIELFSIVKANFLYDMEQKQITIKKESQLIDSIKVKKEYNPDFDKPLSEIETNYEIVKSN